MITTFFLTLIYGAVYVITSPIRLLPDAALPASLSSAIADIGGYLTPLTGFLPVGTILAIFALLLTYEASIFAFKVFNWVRKMFPTQS